MDAIPLADFTGVVRGLKGIPVELDKGAGDLSGAPALDEWM